MANKVGSWSAGIPTLGSRSSMVLIAVAAARQRLITSLLAGFAIGAYIRRLPSDGRWHD